MYQTLSIKDIKARKETVNCPSCGSKTEDFTFMDSGEEFEGRKCKGCNWWGR